MKTTRTDFTDIQRANIFVRDRATCCFSGANLWLLDAPLRPGHQRDWADHVRPSARGGFSDESNGVCASHTFNAKKRHNSADTTYLFLNGAPTTLHFEIFGSLPTEQTKRLIRLSRLKAADWYFNRAIGLVLLAFGDRIGREWYGDNPSRDDNYWLRAALRKLLEFQQFEEGDSLESRRIVLRPDEFQAHWLGLRNVTTENELKRRVAPLYKTYRSNALAWAKYFWDAETDKSLLSALRFAERQSNLTHDTLSCIRDDYKLRSTAK